MCYDVIAIFSGSDRIENQDIGARRCFHLPIYPPGTPFSNRRRHVLQAWGRENFLHCTVTSRLRSTIDRSTNRSRKRERMYVSVCVCVCAWKCVRLAAHYYSGAFAGATIIQGDRRVPRGKFVAAVWWCWWSCRCIRLIGTIVLFGLLQFVKCNDSIVVYSWLEVA